MQEPAADRWRLFAAVNTPWLRFPVGSV
jgi:hypothetical protein